MTGKVKPQKKPGPKPDRLKIEGDPQQALRKLLTIPPPQKKGNEGEPDREEDG